MSALASLLLGAALGAANALAALWIVRRAGSLEVNAALRLVLAGMTARMALVLAAVALVLGLAPVHEGAFLGAFGLLFVVGLVAEVVLVLGRSSGRRQPTPDRL